MHRSEVSRKYFKRLLTAFLCSSIIPLVLCVLAILFINYKLMISEQNKRVESINFTVVDLVEDIFEEYTNILYRISGEDIIKNLLIDNDLNIPDKIGMDIDSILTGRKNKIEVNIIDYDSYVSYSTNKKPNLYDQSIYSEFGIFYKIKSNLNKIVFYPNNYYTDNGQITLSMGKAIVNEKNEILGYAIIDIYEKTLLNQISLISDDAEHLLLYDDSIVVLDTTSNLSQNPSSLLAEKGEMTDYPLHLNSSKNKVTIFGSKYQQIDDYSLYTFIEIKDFYKNIWLLIKISLLMVIIIYVISLLIVKILVKNLYRPIEVVVDAMEEITEGNMEVRIAVDKDNGEMAFMAIVFNSMLDKIRNLLEMVIEETERKKNAEIKALQAQINPHFLYNMLNEIKSLAKLGRTEEVSSFVVSLGKLLRHSISNQENYITIDEELIFLNDYLDLQKIRYENKFECKIEVEEEVLNCKIPTLILQPIIENSIIHGFVDEDYNPILRIDIYRKIDKVFIEIYDNGQGIDKEYLQYINNKNEGSEQYGKHGLENIQKRLLLLYGLDYGINIQSKKDEYTMVLVTIPYQVDWGGK